MSQRKPNIKRRPRSANSDENKNLKRTKIKDEYENIGINYCVPGQSEERKPLTEISKYRENEVRKKSSHQCRTKKSQIDWRTVDFDERIDMLFIEEEHNVPIFNLEEELINKVFENQFLVIEVETGFWKTTQIPQYLYEAGFCANNMKIGCTQPRRVAAMSVAAKVAQEMHVVLGDKVGYSVRFESLVTDQTVIKYMTDGVLLREFLNDPTLASYSVLIINGAHARTLETDLTFGLLKEMRNERPDLKILITCATCDTEKISIFFNAPILRIPGYLCYPVKTYYTFYQEANYTEAAVMTALQIHMTESVGDILVFLTGQKDINDAMYSLNERIKALGDEIEELIILPIYSSLTSEKQAKIFIPSPPGARKIVLATNIAETSLTIDGIKYVIDSGYCKQKWFDPTTRMDTLKVVPITKAAAIQRAGRAGLVAPGKCFRLYKKITFDEDFKDQPVPEIQRTNLANVILLLKSLGIEEVSTFEFIDKPYSQSLLTAIEELYSLGALNTKGKLSLTGRKMVEFPCDPMISKMILTSGKYGCSEEIMTIAAMISLDYKVFYTTKENKLLATHAHTSFMDDEGDQLTLLKVYNEYANNDYSSDWCKRNYIQERTMKLARNIRDQLVKVAEKLGLNMVSNPDDIISIKKAITAGFFLNSANIHGLSYRRIKEKDHVYMQPNCVLAINEDHPRYVLYNNIMVTNKNYMQCVMKIDPKWLPEVAPQIYKDSDFF